MKLADILIRGAADSPDSIAVTHGEDSITYRELLVKCAGLAEYLKGLSIPPGERAAILCENSIDYAIYFFGSTLADLVVVPLDSSLKPESLGYIIKDCGARIFLSQTKYIRFIKRIIEDNCNLEYCIFDRSWMENNLPGSISSLEDIFDRDEISDFDKIINNIDKIAPPECMVHDKLPDCPDELAAIFYTSGSTGKSKGVMLSHLNLVSNTVATVEYLKLKPNDSIICILPFYYIYGNSILLTHFLIGARLVIDNRFAFPQAILDTMKKEKVTGFSGVPSNFMILLNNDNFRADKLPDLRFLTQAGGAMASSVIEKVMAAFTGREICIMYGQTEAAPRVSYLPPEKLKEKLGSAGIPVPGVMISIRDDNGNEMPPGEVGEIVVSGPNVMLGYWNQPDEQAEVLKNRHLYTGDLARRDEDGYIFIVARKKEILKVGGNRVSAREIEETLLNYDKIQEVAVVGTTDDILGEAIRAVIALKDGEQCNPDDIRNHCRTKLAAHKVPQYIDFMDELPKTQAGKINKQALKKV